MLFPTPRTLLARAGTSLRNLFPGGGGQGQSTFWRVLLPGTQFDYEREVGDPWKNSAVYNCLRWAMTNISQPEIQVTRTKGKGSNGGKGVVVEDHPLPKLLRRPNGEYSGKILLAATCLSWNVSGNAYWYIERNNLSRPFRIWWLPHWSVFAQWPADGSQFISEYLYQPQQGGQQLHIPKKDIVHFRFGVDPRNFRYGLSPLSAVMREIWGDNETTTMEAALARNLGIPGLMISPGSPEGTIGDQSRQSLQAQMETFRREGAGKALVAGGQIKVDRLSLTPKEMSLREARFGKEERISGAMGLPAIVAGLGAGMEGAKNYGNYEEAFAQAYHGNIIPTWAMWTDVLDDDLLPAYGDTDRYDVTADYSKIPYLQEDRTALYTDAVTGYQGGLLKRNEGRVMIGLEEVPDGDDFCDVASAETQMALTKAKTPVPATTDSPASSPTGAEEDDEDTDSDA